MKSIKKKYKGGNSFQFSIKKNNINNQYKKGKELFSNITEAINDIQKKDAIQELSKWKTIISSINQRILQIQNNIDEYEKNIKKETKLLKNETQNLKKNKENFEENKEKFEKNKENFEENKEKIKKKIIKMMIELDNIKIINNINNKNDFSNGLKNMNNNLKNIINYLNMQNIKEIEKHIDFFKKMQANINRYRDNYLKT